MKEELSGGGSLCDDRGCIAAGQFLQLGEFQGNADQWPQHLLLTEHEGLGDAVQVLFFQPSQCITINFAFLTAGITLI